MKIGDEVLIHGYVDEIRQGVVIIRNEGGYFGTVEDEIRNAPSVVPSRAEGEWVGTEYDGYADGNPVYYEWICSACKCVVEDEEPTWNYCPNCGAKMKG